MVRMSDAKYFRDLCSAIKQENEELKAETQALRDKVEHLQEELIKFIEFVLEEELPHEKSWDYAVELKERLNL